MNPIAQTITETELADGARLFFAPTSAKNLVAIEGSVLGGWGALPRSLGEVPYVVAELLDAGTRSKSKDVIREGLASKGASLSFRDGVDRTYFSASCFPEDLSYVLSLIAECLGEALLPASEVGPAKKRMLAEFEENLTDTKTQAAGALSRLLFSPEHVNYSQKTNIRATHAAAISRTDLLTFKRSLTRSGLVLAIAGDIEISKARKAAEKAFSVLEPAKDIAQDERPNMKANAPQETLVSISDKANIDTYFGTGVPFTYDNPAFLPFVVLSNMLGGRGLSTGHLMRTIRERDGYTYGIRALQSGFSKDTHGAFRIWATFSPANFEEAVAATRKEIDIFLKRGITESALDTKKDEMVGNYLVGLSTTRGLASMLHTIGTEGKPLSYVDAYPALIRSIALSELTTLAPLIKSDRLSLAASGTFQKR